MASQVRCSTNSHLKSSSWGTFGECVVGHIHLFGTKIAFVWNKDRSSRIAADNETKRCQGCFSAMSSPTYALFRNAILAEQQVICTYDGRNRELCPHIIG